MNFSEKQEKELIEILSNSFDNAQTFNEHKKQNKMPKTRKQYETFIGDGYQLDFTPFFKKKKATTKTSNAKW